MEDKLFRIWKKNCFFLCLELFPQFTVADHLLSFILSYSLIWLKIISPFGGFLLPHLAAVNNISEKIIANTYLHLM